MPAVEEAVESKKEFIQENIELVGKSWKAIGHKSLVSNGGTDSMEKFSYWLYQHYEL